MPYMVQICLLTAGGVFLTGMLVVVCGIIVSAGQFRNWDYDNESQMEALCEVESHPSSEKMTIIIKVWSGLSGLLYLCVKRIFDFLASAAASILLALPMLAVAVLIARADAGNPFFSQLRVGLRGAQIRVYKFRTMRKGSENPEKALTAEQYRLYRKEYKLKDDPRLIGSSVQEGRAACLGRNLRLTSMDELPQILMNVCIFGNMSFVGPRPILEQELKDYYTPSEQELLLSVKPGITGYWQAYGHNDAGYEKHRRQEMELYYARHRSVWLDAAILLKTAVNVIQSFFLLLKLG